MNRLARFFVSLALVLAAPGLAPYQAAAQTMGASRVVVPVAPIGAAGASINSLGGANAVLPSAGFTTGLTPSLTPSAAPAPAFNPAAIVVTLSPSAVHAAANDPVALAVVPATAKAVAPVLGGLQNGTNTLSKAVDSASPDAPRVALDGLFEGSASRPDTLAVAARPAASDAPRLDPAASREPAKGPRWVKPFRAPDAAPRTSVKRTLSVGFLAAVIPIAITMAAIVVAQMFGYQLHPNYQGPGAGELPSVLSALALWAGAAIMAPVSEEAIFRGGMQGKLARFSAKLRLGNFIVPALITSTLFVALHETSDPVLFATRMVHALILSYVYYKEGILASMAAHGFFNGLLALSIVAGALGAPWLALAAVPAAIYFSFKARAVLKAQKADIASGALIRKPMTGLNSLLFAALLAFGYFMIMPNIFWAAGAVLLLIDGTLKLRKA